MVKTGNTLWHCFNIEFNSFDRILLPLKQPSWCGDQCVHFESCPHFAQEVSSPDSYTITVQLALYQDLMNEKTLIILYIYVYI